MGAREDILAALRRAEPPAAPLPDLASPALGLGLRLADPAARFAEAVATSAGTCVRVPDRAAAARALTALPVYRAAKKIVSRALGMGSSTLDLAAISDPRQLEGLDLAVLPGELGVAENGAVWVDGAALPQRAVFVIAEHLVLVVSARDVVADMHQAYARLAARPVAYGLFIAGPSKTADIEQALVIGAQGPRSCTVFLLD
jgi:L-lactate dehydrogenase complex protein LldG